MVKTTESLFSQGFDLFFWPLSVLTWTPVSLHWNAFEAVERSSGKDLSSLSALSKDIGNDWNLPVSDTKVLLELTALLHCMVFIGKEILFPLHYTVFRQLDKRGELLFDNSKKLDFVEVAVTTGLFSKTFVDDVDIELLLPATICWGVCKQAES